MARCYQHWTRISGYDDPSAWVYRVALNWARSVLRKRQVRRRRNASESNGTRSLHSAEAFAETTTDIGAAMELLSLDHRAVVICRIHLDMDVAVTAKVLGIRQGTVKSRLHRALDQLRAALNEGNADA